MIAKMADLYDNLSDRIDSPKLRKTARRRSGCWRYSPRG